MRLKPQYVFILAVLGVLVVFFVVMSLFSGNKKAEAMPAWATISWSSVR